jgi:hypothetical protein
MKKIAHMINIFLKFWCGSCLNTLKERYMIPCSVTVPAVKLVTPCSVVPALLSTSSNDA